MLFALPHALCSDRLGYRTSPCVRSSGKKALKFCCDSDTAIKKAGVKFDTAVIKIMHASFGFHTPLGEVEVRLPNHPKGPSSVATTGAGTFPLFHVDDECPDDKWDIVYCARVARAALPAPPCLLALSLPSSCRPACFVFLRFDSDPHS